MCYPTQPPLVQRRRASEERIERELDYLAQHNDLPENPAELDLTDVDQASPAVETTGIQGIHPRILEQYANFSITTRTLNMLMPTSDWDGQRLANEIIQIEVVDCFREALRRESHVVIPGDQLLRRLHCYIPPRLSFDSWISGAILTFIIDRYKIRMDDIYSLDDGRSLVYQPNILIDVEEDNLEPQSRKKIERMLRFLPFFLNQLAITWAAWLPYELQLVATSEPIIIYQYLHGLDYYYPDDELIETTPRQNGPHFYTICAHVAEILLCSGWADLPFGKGIHWALRESWGVPRRKGTLQQRTEIRLAEMRPLEEARRSGGQVRDELIERGALNLTDVLLERNEMYIVKVYGEAALEELQAWTE